MFFIILEVVQIIKYVDIDDSKLKINGCFDLAMLVMLSILSIIKHMKFCYFFW